MYLQIDTKKCKFESVRKMYIFKRQPFQIRVRYLKLNLFFQIFFCPKTYIFKTRKMLAICDYTYVQVLFEIVQFLKLEFLKFLIFVQKHEFFNLETFWSYVIISRSRDVNNKFSIVIYFE